MMLPFALTRRGWAFVIAAAGLWVCSRVVGLGDLRYLAALLLAMVLVALPSSLVLSALARFDLRLSVPSPTPTVGEPSTFVLVVGHRFPVTLPVRVVWETAAETTGQTATKSAERTNVSLVVPRASEVVVRTGLVAHNRGPQRVGVTALVVPDPLGLVARRLRHNTSAELLVLPRLLETLPDELDAMTRAEAGATLRGRSADSGGTVGAVREYRTGDSMRQVHWKQSARQGELLVKVHDTGDAAQRSILLVTDPAAYSDGAEFETAVSATAAVAARWLDNGQPVQLHLGDRHPNLCTRRSEMLRHLATAHITLAPAKAAGTPAEPMLSTLGGQGSADVVVSGTVSRQLARQLESTRSSGTLLTTCPTAEYVGSAGWSQVMISSPVPAGSRGVKVGDHG
ncbi:DUF58 domain-containing protein [Nocardioides sp. NPDC023903]|uniref:DUF58 domain-containing protein n=1 Tax=Nocardioides sp. NPDC023903 TaxID=3157195 RepID=UPI0033FB0FE9